MNLTVQERIMALSILPQQGSYAMLKTLHKLRLSLSFNDEDFKKFGIVETEVDGQRKTSWKSNDEAEIPIGEKATDLIIDSLRKLDKQNKLPEQAMSLYEKFIPDN